MKFKFNNWSEFVTYAAGAAEGKVKRRDLAETEGKAKLGKLPEWALADLYEGPESHKLKADLATSERAAEAMQERYAGKLAGLLDGGKGGAPLAQAVQLVAYEWRQALGGFPVVERVPDAALATDDEVQGLLEHWREAMTEVGFLDPAVPRRLLPRLRRLMNRAALSREEVQILRGLARSVLRGRR